MTTRSHTVNTRANFQRADTVTWIGNSCGRHGSYVFYKAFRFRPTKPTHVTLSSGVARTRRERRNTVGEGDATKSTGEKFCDVADPPILNSTSDERILCLGEFFFVQCRPEDPVCVGELQLLWHDKHSGQDLSSTRLYYLPETTPAGRTNQHGQDEVLAVSEKVVMRTNDLASWVVEPEEWNYGCSLPTYKASFLTRMKQPVSISMHHSSRLRACVNMNDVEFEKQLLMIENLCSEHRNYAKEKITEKLEQLNREPITGLEMQKLVANVEEQKPSIVHCSNCSNRHQKAQVMVLSLTSYCRHKAAMRRLEGLKPKWLSHSKAGHILSALGAITSHNSKLRIVFCRDTFDYSQLFEHDLICEEFAPVFKGRPRKKAKKTANLNLGKSKKMMISEDFRNGVNAENSETNPEKGDNDDATRINRRRSKRKNPQRSSDDEGYALTVTLSRTKRSRRGHARTPTPVSTPANEKSATSGASKSEPSSPTEKEVEESGRRRSKRRPRPRPSDLRIALRNSLLENHKVSKIESKETKKRLQRQSSSASSASDSSRSSSPTDRINEACKASSPTPGSNSSTPSTPSDVQDAHPSPESSSPLDFTAAVTPPDSAEVKKDLDLTSETNMYLRGLSEGHLPENKSEFLDLLYQFMRKRNTPIGRIPSLGFKKLDLWAFFKLSQEYGGYDMVTAKRLWKHVYDRMGGNPSCTSAATCTRKHFEKLLLPLEVYLRQAVTKAKNEEITSTTKTETSTALNSFNGGRTFDGDVYFPNSGKINSSASSIDEHKPLKIEASRIETSSTSNTIIAETESSSVMLSTTSVTSSVPTVTSSAPAQIPPMINGFNLDSLVQKVVQKEMMPDHGQPSKQEVKDNAVEKLKKSEGKIRISNPVEVIDLTEGSGRQPTATIQPDMSNKAPVYSKSQIYSAAPKPQFFTRTHCPRNSNAPPPFIPKPSASKVDPVKHIPADKKRAATAYVDLSRIQRENMSRDENKLQKRTSAYSSSPPSPKRPRDSLVPEVSPSNRSFTDSNLASANIKLSVRHDRLINEDYHKSNSRYKTINTELLSSKGSGFNALARPTSHSSTVYITRPKSPQHFDRRVPSETSRISAKQLPNSSESYRTMPNRSERDSAVQKFSSSHRFSSNEEKSYKEKSYYRPTGMLAVHRQQQAKNAANLSNGAIKEDKYLVEDKDVHKISNLTHPRSSVNTASESIKKEYAISAMQSSRPPVPPPLTKKEQSIGRSSFSSSFSVDRLTSDSDKRSTLPTGSSASRTVRSEDLRPRFPITSSAYTTVPRYVDPRQVPYKTISEKEGYRPTSSVNDSVCSDRARWNLNSQSYNGITQTPPSSIMSSSLEKSSAAMNCRAILEKLTPELARIVRAQMPPDCSPTTLNSILLKLFSPPPPTNSLPHTLTGISFPGQGPVLSEHLLRQDPLLMRNPTGQQAVLNEMRAEQQLALMQMYNNFNFLASTYLTANPVMQPLQDPIAAVLSPSNQARSAISTKVPAHSSVLGQPSRAPINFQQSSILMPDSQRSQPRGTEVTPSIHFPIARR